MKLLIVLVLAVATVNAARLNTLLKPAIASGRIINGQEAAKGEAPYIISLQTTGLFGGHFCAGSLITPNLVLTAAHCLTPKSLDAVAGLHIRSDKSDVQVRKVTSQQYRQHEQYSGGVGPFDIGLIYIPEAFNINDLRDNAAPVNTISLPSGKYAQTGRGKLYGWGRDETATSPQVLQTLDADVIGFTECQRQLPIGAPLDKRSNICSHTVGKNDGACNGDSGGPLIINTVSGPELVGVVSWGYTPCHKSTYPSVFTAVSEFHQWIDDTAAELATTTA